MLFFLYVSYLCIIINSDMSDNLTLKQIKKIYLFISINRETQLDSMMKIVYFWRLYCGIREFPLIKIMTSSIRVYTWWWRRWGFYMDVETMSLMMISLWIWILWWYRSYEDLWMPVKKMLQYVKFMILHLMIIFLNFVLSLVN